MANKCKMCGLCCKLFLINLSEAEYRSGRYRTVCDEMPADLKFSDIRKYGLNLVAQKEDGSCIYLSGNTCSIHGWRPKVCHGFFCSSKSQKYAGMRQTVEKARLLEDKDRNDQGS